jgi:CxxC motif-containing protein (DUF1111 family)
MRLQDLIHMSRTGLTLGIGCLLVGWSSATIASDEGGSKEERRASARAGGELFSKEWTPGEPSRHGGDGLGPVYNETSCVACHNLGGVGGAGPASKNIQTLSASVTPIQTGLLGQIMGSPRDSTRKLMAEMAKTNGKELPNPRAEGEAVNRDPLIKFHRGFEESSSISVHRFGPERDYEGWRIQILDSTRLIFRDWNFDGDGHVFQESARALNFSRPFEYGHFTLTRSELNPAPLFGTGLIDSIPDEAIEAASTRQVMIGFRLIKGRVSRLSDGKIGRFGWKAQASSLDSFVLTACAVELGLEVPGHPQAENPRSPKAKAPGLDLSRSECASLTKYVRGLPAPIENLPSNPVEAATVTKGRVNFEKVGCGACHIAKLGPVDGIYSDLLLHDMGPALSDAGSYSVAPSSDDDNNNGTLPGMMPNGPLAFEGAKPPIKGPSRSEWRTPPLWGVRDSGPYLHDGRAETLEQAISFHDGQARSISAAYFKLSTGDRQAVLRFLKSLQAPAQVTTRENGREAPDFKVSPDAVGLR